MIILVGLGSAFFAAVTNVYLKKLFCNASTNELAPLNFTLNTVTILFLFPFFGGIKISVSNVFLILAVLILDFLANYFYYNAIEHNEVSYVSIFSSLSPVFTLLIYTIFIDFISLKALIAILGIIISIYILNLNGKASIYEPFLNIFKNKNYYGLLIAFFLGCSAIFTKEIFNNNITNAFTLYFLRSVFLSILFSILLKPKFNKINMQTVIHTWIRSLFVIVHLLLYFYALSLGNVVVASTVSNSYPLFVLILSYFMFKEKITVQKFGSIICMLFCMVLLYNTL